MFVAPVAQLNILHSQNEALPQYAVFVLPVDAKWPCVPVLASDDDDVRVQATLLSPSLASSLSASRSTQHLSRFERSSRLLRPNGLVRLRNL